MVTGRLDPISGWPVLWAASALLAGCFGGGTVVVGFVLDSEVAIRDADGRAGQAGAAVAVPRGPAAHAMQYRGQDFEWSLGAGGGGLGGWVANMSAATICMRFDEALIRSNFHPEPIPLRITSWTVFREQWSRLGSSDPRKPEYFGPPTFCLDPGKQARVGFAPDLRPLFPTQKMFNVQWAGNEPQLTDKGLGNWVALTVPVEVGEKRQVFDVKLTPVESHARISYH